MGGEGGVWPCPQYENGGGVGKFGGIDSGGVGGTRVFRLYALVSVSALLIPKQSREQRRFLNQILFGLIFKVRIG